LFGSLAAAVVVMSASQGLSMNLLHILFGSVSTVTSGDLYVIIPLAIVTFILIGVSYKKLFLVSLNEDLAKTSGIRADLYNLLLILLTAVTVVIAMRVVGILLIGALMVIPVLAAMQYRVSFRSTFIIAVIFSLSAMIVGLFLSYYLDLPSGGVVVLLALALFLISLVLGRERSS
jgi:zinc transport system permease protein